MGVVENIYREQKRRVKLGWYGRYGGLSYITIEYKNKGDIENESKHKMLDKKARDWGEIQERKTIYNDKGVMIKRYECSGHGGYLMLVQEDIGGIVDKSWEQFDSNRIPEFYIHEYEEDCGWSKLIVEAPTEIREAILKEWRKDYERWNSDAPDRGFSEMAWDSYKRNHLENKNELRLDKLIS